MVNATRIQNMIDRGYAQAARRIGLDFDLYRPIAIDQPLKPANRIDRIRCSFNINGKYTGQSKANQLYWQIIAEGCRLEIGDYLVGEATYVVVAKDPLMPPIALRCTDVLNFSRIAADTDVGLRPYGAPLPQVPYATGIPAATAIKRESGKPTAGLPADAAMRGFYGAFFYLPVGTVQTRDTATDETGENYQVTAVSMGLLGTEALLELVEM